MHEATRLQLVNTVNSMEDRIISTQRAILFQSQEVSLSRGITELRSNAPSARLRLLTEVDEGKRKELAMLLGTMQDEEKRLKTELSKTSHDFLTLVQGAAVGQLISNVRAAPRQDPISMDSLPVARPGLCRSADERDQEQQASAKKRRLNMTASMPNSGTVQTNSRTASMSSDDPYCSQLQVTDVIPQ